MKLFARIILFLLCPLVSLSQQGNPPKNALLSQHDLSNIERYQLDYELIDYTFIDGDSSILNELNITGMIESRSSTVDVEMTDIQHGVRILVYSELRSKDERNFNPLETSHSKSSAP